MAIVFESVQSVASEAPSTQRVSTVSTLAPHKLRVVLIHTKVGSIRALLMNPSNLLSLSHSQASNSQAGSTQHHWLHEYLHGAQVQGVQRHCLLIIYVGDILPKFCIECVAHSGLSTACYVRRQHSRAAHVAPQMPWLRRLHFLRRCRSHSIRHIYQRTV